MTDIRTGQADGDPDREQFDERFARRFFDPAFDGERDAIARLQVIAWHNLEQGRKAPRARPAGAGFADAAYELSDEWRATRDKLAAAQTAWQDSASPSRVLVVCGSARNDGTCPGEVSKSWRLARLVDETVRQQGLHADFLDLSRVTS